MLPEMRFTETRALLAVLEGDKDRALRILLDDMSPFERMAFRGQLDQLAALADDRMRCPRCHRPAGEIGDAYAREGHWHRTCLAAQRADEAAALEGQTT